MATGNNLDYLVNDIKGIGGEIMSTAFQIHVTARFRIHTIYSFSDFH